MYLKIMSNMIFFSGRKIGQNEHELVRVNTIHSIGIYNTEALHLKL